MHIIKMGQRGQTFDGLDSTEINIDNQVYATNYEATNAVGQYGTTQTNLDFITFGTSPIFSFKNNAGTTENTTILVDNITTTTQNTIELNVTSNGIDSAITATGDSNSVPLTFIYNEGDATTLQVVGSSGSSSTINIETNTTTSNYSIQALTPALETGNSTSFVLGKDVSNNTNAFLFRYIYDTLEARRRLELRAFGASSPSTETFLHSITGTNAQTGTFVVTGDLASTQRTRTVGLSLYPTSAATSSVNLNAASGTADYSLIFPSSMGTTNDFLQLANSGTGQLAWAPVSTGALNIAAANNVLGGSGVSIASNPILRVQGTGNATHGILNVINSRTGSDTVLSVFQPSLISSTSTSINFGVAATNWNSALLQFFNAGTGSSNNQFTVTMFGQSATLVVGGPNVTSGNGGNAFSTEVRGGLKAQNSFMTGSATSTSLLLKETSGSSNSLTLRPATGQGNYTLIFPASMGTTNDYLQLASSGTGQLQWASSGGGGSGAAYVAALQHNSTTQTLATTVSAVVQFPTAVYNLNTSLEYNTGGAANPYYFKNISGGTVYVQVHATTDFAGPATTNTRLIEIRYATSTSQAPTSATVMATSKVVGSSSVSVATSVSAIVKLAANECFLVYATNSDTSTLTLTSKIYASVIGGSGLQSLTLSLDANAQTLFTTNGQQTGLNPSITLNMVSAPTGTGGIVLASTPTIANPTTTGTLTAAALTATTVTSPAIYETSLQLTTSASTFSLTTANTRVFISGSTAGYTIQLPTTASLNLGSLITIINNSTQSVTIQTSTSVTIDTLLPNQISRYSVLSTGAQTWRDIGLMDKEKVEQTNSSLILKSGVTLQLTASNSNLVGIQPSATTTAYNFILPTTTGSVGQFLTSNGSGNSLTWSNSIIPTNVPIELTVAGSYIGDNTTSVTSSPALKIEGTAASGAGTSGEVLAVRNYNVGSTTSATFYSPNLNDTSFTAIRFGKSATSLNSASMRWYHAADASPSNQIFFQLFGQTTSIKIRNANISADAAADLGTLKVEGGIAASSNIQTLSTNNVFGSSTAIITSTPILKLEGLGNSQNGILQVVNYQTTDNTSIRAFAPNLLSGSITSFRFGRDSAASYNHASLDFNYQGSGSSSNYITLGLSGVSKTLSVYEPNIQTSLVITGGFTATGLSVSGAFASNIGTSATTISSAPVLKMEGTGTSLNGVAQITNYQTGSNTTLRAMAPDLTTTNTTGIRFGKDTAATYNSARLGYSYVSSGSTSNSITLGFNVTTPSLEVFAPTLATTLTVNGGVTATGLSVSGTIASNIGTSSTTIASAPVLKVEGTGTSTNAVLQANNYDSTTSDIPTISSLAPNMPTTASQKIIFGKQATTNNSGELGFYYAGAGSANNQVAIDLYGQSTSLAIQGPNITAGSGSNDFTADVRGGLKSQNSYVTGAESTNTMAVRAAGPNALTVTGIDITPTRGEYTDLALWWSTIDNSGGDPVPLMNLTYASITYEESNAVSPVQNQYYAWQKIGWQYTFQLNLQVQINSATDQVHMLFLHSDSHDPPVPAGCGSGYTMQVGKNAGFIESYLSQAEFKFGVYIPCT